ncbi:MAG: DUF2961 domain-containing protein [Bacteroidales bacterium]
MDRSISRSGSILFALATAILAGLTGCDRPCPDEPFLIKKKQDQGLSSGLWYYDEERGLAPLLGHTTVTIADLKGPGIVRMLRMSQLSMTASPDLPRGIVLEIYYDDASKPAVQVPAADFFGDGCQGKGIYYSSTYLEKVPEAYNCYIPMPFKKRIRIQLRNDTGHYYAGYSAVEWEKLPAWNREYGYFYATFTRKSFRLQPETKVRFFSVTGTGHFLGRQMSVVTSTPLYTGNLGWVMEGNNYFSVDGKEKAFNYLGTEDAFTFSHGFVRTWVGQHGGITHVVHKGLQDSADTAELSIFRMHDHMPIRFEKSFEWTINWQYETMFAWPQYWRKQTGPDGGWVDYAAVTYWYMTSPDGFDHEPLAPLAERSENLLPPNTRSPEFAFPEPDVEPAIMEAFRSMNVDPDPVNTISSEKDMQRINITGAYPGTHPFFIDQPRIIIWQPGDNGHIGQPNPGRTGIVAVHPASLESPCLLFRKLNVPATDKPLLHLVVSGDPYGQRGPRWEGEDDFVIRVGIHDGRSTAWLDRQILEPGDKPDANNWYLLDYELSAYKGKTVLIVVEIPAGGKNNHWFNEEAFFDEISVKVEK